jgi:hypothetical protein
MRDKAEFPTKVECPTLTKEISRRIVDLNPRRGGLMPMRATRAAHVPPSLSDVRFKAISMPATTRKSSLRRDVTDRIRCEFAEMRGFSPTIDQAARLFQISREECVHVLSKLVDEGFLRRTTDGRYRLPPQQ